MDGDDQAALIVFEFVFIGLTLFVVILLRKGIRLVRVRIFILLVRVFFWSSRSLTAFGRPTSFHLRIISPCRAECRGDGS